MGKNPQECLHQPGINNLESQMTQFIAQMTLSQPSADGKPNAPDNTHCGEHSQISCMEVVQNNTSTLQSQCDTCGVAVDHYDASTRQRNSTFSMPPHGVPVAVELTPNVPPPISLQNRTYHVSEEFTKELNKLKAQVSQLRITYWDTPNF